MAALSLKEFNKEVNIAIPYLKEYNAAKFKLDPGFVQGLVDHLAEWQALWAKTQDKTTRTSTLVEEQRVLKDRFEKAFRNMQQAIKNSSRKESFTSEDLDKLFIHRDKKRHSIPVPTLIPDLTITNLVQGELDLQISAPSLPDFNHRALPGEINATNIFVALAAVGAAPPPEEAFHLFQTVTKADAKLRFEQQDWRKVAYLKAAFLNSKGEAGPLSKAINAVIPG